MFNPAQVARLHMLTADLPRMTDARLAEELCTLEAEKRARPKAAIVRRLIELVMIEHANRFAANVANMPDEMLLNCSHIFCDECSNQPNNKGLRIMWDAVDAELDRRGVEGW